MQPSDRVVAKVIMKAFGILGATLLVAGINPHLVNHILQEVAEKADGGDLEIRAAVTAVRDEVTAEVKAEQEGRAVPNVRPLPEFTTDNYD